jgi:hypothetical protein
MLIRCPSVVRVGRVSSSIRKALEFNGLSYRIGVLLRGLERGRVLSRKGEAVPERSGEGVAGASKGLGGAGDRTSGDERRIKA